MNVKTVACLAGDGVGPELMAAATRALDRVASLHHLNLDDRHVPASQSRESTWTPTRGPAPQDRTTVQRNKTLATSVQTYYGPAERVR